MEILATLDVVPGERADLRTRAGGRLGVTRVFAPPVPLASSALVERAVFGGSIENLPETLERAIESFRIRARLGAFAGMPAVLGAGVATFDRAIMPPAPGGAGHAYVTSAWVEGANLGDVRAALPLRDRVAVAAGLIRLLAQLHDRGVVHGRVEPRGVVLVGGEPWLLELDSLREGDPARDMLAFGRLARWLLDPELTSVPPSPVLAPWRPLISACLASGPGTSPASRDLHAAISGPTDAVAVADPPGDRTIFVPDPQGRARGRWRWPWVAVMVVLVLIAIGVALAILRGRSGRRMPVQPTSGWVRHGERPFEMCRPEARLRAHLSASPSGTPA